MSEGIYIQTTQNVPLLLEPATLGDRILAYLLDILILFAYIFVAMMIWGGVFGSLFSTAGSTSFTMIASGIALFLPAFAYHFLFEAFNNGQSPGKKALEIKVVAKDGSEASVGMYLIRWLFRFVDISLFYGIIAIITIAVSKDNQRLGDMVANTAVIKLKKKVSVNRVPYVASREDHEVQYPMAIKLSRDEVSLIKETLSSREVVDIDDYVEILADKIASTLELPPPENARHFLRDLLKDYSHLRS